MRKVYIYPHPCLCLLFSVFVRKAIPVDVRWYLFKILILNSLVISDVEDLFLYLLVTRISSLEKCLSESFLIIFFKCPMFNLHLVNVSCLQCSLIIIIDVRIPLYTNID